MLTIEKKDADTLTLVSDDRNAENMAVQDAFEGMEYPVLAGIWEEAEMGDDGTLRADFTADYWSDLQEALGGVDAPDAAECEQAIIEARRERDGQIAAEG